MKRIYCLVIVVLSILCAQAQDGYTVNGNIQGLSDGSIEIKKEFDGTVLNVAEVKNGKFVFIKLGDFEGDKVYLVNSALKTKHQFYIEPGVINLNGNVNKVVASGTISNDANNKYLEVVAPIEKRIGELRQAIRVENDTAKKAKLQKELNYQYSDVFYPMRKRFALENNNTILAAEFLSAGTGQLTYSDMKKLLASLDPKTSNNWYTSRLKNRCEILRTTDIGQMLPNFSLPDTSGTAFTFSSLRGNIVLVDFWASWCKPCREENQNVLQLYNRYNKDGFTVVSVSIDESREKWVAAIVQDKLTWNHVSSLTGWSCPVSNSLGVAYGMSGVPYTLLVGRDGKVIGHNVRGEKLEEKLEELFQTETSKTNKK